MRIFWGTRHRGFKIFSSEQSKVQSLIEWRSYLYSLTWMKHKKCNWKYIHSSQSEYGWKVQIICFFPSTYSRGFSYNFLNKLGTPKITLTSFTIHSFYYWANQISIHFNCQLKWYIVPKIASFGYCIQRLRRIEVFLVNV